MLTVVRFFLFLSLSLFAAEPCQTKLLKLINRVSPLTKSLVSKVEGDHTVRLLNPKDEVLKKIFSPEYQSKVLDAGDIQFSVVNLDEFSKVYEKTKDHGIWTIYYPSSPDSQLQVGHFAVSIGGDYFTRNVDQPRSDSMLSSNHFLPGGVGEHPGVLVQFFELNPESVSHLKKFMNDRVWLHHQGVGDYHSEYVPLPLTRDSGRACGENCVTFVYPFFMERWLRQRPELASIQAEMGNMRVTEVPSRQVYLNTESNAYRGTLIIARDKELVEKALYDGTFNSHPEGMQLLFDGVVQKK